MKLPADSCQLDNALERGRSLNKKRFFRTQFTRCAMCRAGCVFFCDVKDTVGRFLFPPPNTAACRAWLLFTVKYCGLPGFDSLRRQGDGFIELYELFYQMGVGFIG